MPHKGSPAQRAQRHKAAKIALDAAPRLSSDINSKQFDRRVQKTLELLQQSSLAAPIRLADIAATVHVSSSHLRHLFKQEVGTSVKHYRKSLQLRRAKELMETTFLSVKEVMSAVGFNDLSHFVREYKRAFGRTPSETRLPDVRRPPNSRRARKSRPART